MKLPTPHLWLVAFLYRLLLCGTVAQCGRAVCLHPLADLIVTIRIIACYMYCVNLHNLILMFGTCLVTFNLDPPPLKNGPSLYNNNN